MTTTLTVIALVTSLKTSNQTVYGDAAYREVTDQYSVFGYKQFSNARHEYNVEFREGDLVKSIMINMVCPTKSLSPLIFINSYSLIKSTKSGEASQRHQT